MHTTTFSEMFPIGEEGYIIDTPGIKGFGTFDMEDEEVGHYFKEIFEFSAKCKYGNCTHRHEPGCAVREAVENHYISESRYASYLNILEDKEEGNTAQLINLLNLTDMKNSLFVYYLQPCRGLQLQMHMQRKTQDLLQRKKDLLKSTRQMQKLLSVSWQQMS